MGNLRTAWIKRAGLMVSRWSVVATALLWSPGSTQEPSMVLKSLDNLEKRLIKIEGDVAKVRKAGPAAVPEKTAAQPDTALRALAARFDSLLARVDSLGTSATAVAADATQSNTSVTQAAPPAAPSEGEIAALVREVKELTAQLKQGRSPRAAATPSIPPVNPALAAAAPAAPAANGAASAVPNFELKGDIQIQGERKLTSQSNRDNLDDFWGRLNFGGEYKSADFESKLNIRIFPEGFGFEPLTGATYDTTGQGSLKLQTQPSARIVINHAWARYTVSDFRLKVGRFETVETFSENFGNYVDLAPGGKFMSRPAVHNAMELSRTFGPFAGSTLLGTNDRKLNRGFLRVYGKYAPAKTFQAALGWRANAFDRFKYPKDEISQRYDVNLMYAGLPLGWKAFAEAALLQAPRKPDDTPLLLGMQPNAGKALDLLAFEAEWLPTRKAGKEYKEWLYNIHARKVLGRLKLDAGLQSDLADPDWDAFGFGLRMTSNIK
jgi:hypothetical protein